MKNYSKNISPDSLTGSIFALEGIKDACVILNGPTGCKFYHSAISDNQFIRSLSFDPSEYSEKFFFGQARVPSTYLDNDNYVYGSGEKLEEILKLIGQKDYQLIGLVNSPGAALIGDDLNAFLRKEIKDIPTVSLESSGYSTTYGTGFENTMMRVLDSLDYATEDLAGLNVNLLGINIYQKYYADNIKVIRDLLSLLKINIIASIGGGDSIKDLQKINKADLNILVYPEYGRKTAEMLNEKFNTPFLIPAEGVPIGFDATESFINEIRERLKIKPSAAIEEIEQARARAYLYLARFSSLTGLPNGSAFSIRGEASFVYPLTKWLSSYLGMTPVAIDLLADSDDGFNKKLADYLGTINSLEALNREITQTETDLLFADGNTIAQLKLAGHQFSAIEINLPSLGYINVFPKTLFGQTGSLYLLEQILNGLRFLL